MLKRFLFLVWVVALLISGPTTCSMASNKGTPLLAIIPLGIALSPLVANAIYWVITGKEKTLGDFLK